MLSLAARYNLRLIVVNMRDYSGSTPYTEAQLGELLKPDVEVQAGALRRYGQEIAAFLAFVCKNLDISPTATQGLKKSAGLVLMVWSLSALGFVTMFGDPAVLDENKKTALAPYLRKVILHGRYHQFVTLCPLLTHLFKTVPRSHTETTIRLD